MSSATRSNVRVRAVPESRPAAATWTTPSASPTSQAPLAFTVAELQPRPSDEALIRTWRSWERPPPARLPDVHAWSHSLAQAIMETLQGRRPASQLTRWLDERVLAAITLRARPRAEEESGPSRPIRIRSVRVQFPRDRVAEVAVHLTRGRRSRAMALRLEASGQRWLCTALELGPRVTPPRSPMIPEQTLNPELEITPAAAPSSSRDGG